MTVNQYLPFATGGSPTVLSNAAYSALAARSAGFTNGIAVPEQVNTVWRQASVVAAMIGQFTADYGGVAVMDDGDVAALETKFVNALHTQLYQQLNGLVYWGGTSGGAANAQTVTLTPTLTGASLPTPTIVFFVPGFTNTGTATLTVNSYSAHSFKKPDGTDLTGGEIVSGSVCCAVYSGTNFYLMTAQAVGGGGGGGTGLTAVAADAPLAGDGTSGNHLTIRKATAAANGYGRVANSTEGTTGVSSTIDGVGTPWITPEQLAAYVAAYLAAHPPTGTGPLDGLSIGSYAYHGITTSGFGDGFTAPGPGTWVNRGSGTYVSGGCVPYGYQAGLYQRVA